MGLDFSVLPPFYGTLALGVLWTVAITAASAVLSFFGGILLAVIALYAPMAIRLPFRFLAWLFMGTPLLLQLFLIYFGLVQIGIDLPAFVAGVIGLGFHFAVYNSELIQTAMIAVDKGQMEAARTLGLSRRQALIKVVVPQAVRDVIPPIGNNMIALLKDSALVSVIGVSELTLSAQRAIGQTYRAFEFYAAAAVLYYIINLGMEAVLRWFENRNRLYR
ncbi:MAG: amino acid ABC transporter permease [Thioclava marina]|jgi:amino acid ABC transporter membrane protein 2, PAAT family (TC 3.A.1.3.-)|uniref:Amino acid ABC transporter permease n=1 Tax=Thioclava marina TaxID=1915077 RepID=A0ABX3MK38_9RHOB|nr:MULTISPECIES: amino acid ABC transporter permease [Thioclava]TNE93430.1 MAG: amino acid ABC transporter permease [Paracoccaceae bacterium]MBC7145955.1 amino acid ABC transporter permease [Thioclava marina]MBD3803397.1 amino acid ABC transporter permease [Thioclava sp.]OOY11893.1 amino acid ABC transporter permease [Thioclava marina]OOY26811.1 amino acid ABC transporter permease [Thioclava sp. L04-15]